MKVLISAYACAPDQGSEPLVGWIAVVAAAAEHRVWVLTQPRMVEVSRRGIEMLGLSGRVTIVGVAPDATENQSGLKALAMTHARHERWQRNAAQAAAALHAEVGFDVAHHITLAAYWMPTGVSSLPVPLVWGPVGGGVVTPPLLLPELGPAGLAEEVARRLVRRAFLLRPSVRALPARASVIFAQNAETMARMPAAAPRLLNNGITSVVSEPLMAAPRTRDVVVVARLDAWKGVSLALRAFARLGAGPGSGPGVGRLRVFGNGRERERLERLIARRELTGRVVLEGHRPRGEVLQAIATAGALLSTSLHDEGGGAVSEALALGTPVVALRRGGPGVLPGEWPASPVVFVAPAPAPLLARRLAGALTAAVALQPPTRTTGLPPAHDFGAELLKSYAMAAGHPLRESKESADPGQPG